MLEERKKRQVDSKPLLNYVSVVRCECKTVNPDYKNKGLSYNINNTGKYILL